jgi:hypothetical protein
VARIRDDLDGSVFLHGVPGGPVILFAGDEVPEGFVVGAHLLADDDSPEGDETSEDVSPESDNAEGGVVDESGDPDASDDIALELEPVPTDAAVGASAPKRTRPKRTRGPAKA